MSTDGTVTDGPYPEATGGLCVVDVRSREEALEWAAKTAVACRCAQEVREFLSQRDRSLQNLACAPEERHRSVRQCSEVSPEVIG